MGRAGIRAATIAGLVAVGALTSACSDDGQLDLNAGIPEEQYEENLAALCAQHGTALAEAGGRFATDARSNAERVAYFRTDWIPRVRTIIVSLSRQGFPEGRVQEYLDVLNGVNADLDRFRDHTYDFIDAYNEGRLEDDDNYIALVLAGLTEVGIDCVS